MENINDDEWDLLFQLFCAAKKFDRGNHVSHCIESECVSSSNQGMTWKRISLNVHVQKYSNVVFDGVNCLKTFLSVPLEDQLILLKECTLPLVHLLAMFMADKSVKSHILYALNGHLHVGIHFNHNRLDETTKGMDTHDTLALEIFYDFLRIDGIAFNLICCHAFFRTFDGISCIEAIEKESKLYWDLLDKYVDSKIVAGHWSVDKDSIMSNVKQVIEESIKFGEAYLEYSIQLHKMLESQTLNTIKHESIIVSKSPGSNIELTLLSIKSTPAITRTIEIRVKIKDGLVEGTNYTLQDLINESSEDIIISNDSSNNLVLQNNEGNEISLLRLPAIQSVFQVMVSSSRSMISSVMESTTETEWTRLTQAVSFSKALSGVYNGAKDSVTCLDSNTSDTQRISIVTDWLVIGKSIHRALELLDGFVSLSLENKYILRKECVTEIMFCQIISFFNKENNCFITQTLRKQLLIQTHIRYFKSYGQLSELIMTTALDFYDFIRKDVLVMGLISILFVFHERQDISNKHLILQERHAFMDLLDKYIHAKVKSGDWTHPVNVIWDHIHRRMNQLSNIKHVFENTTVSHVAFSDSFTV